MSSNYKFKNLRYYKPITSTIVSGALIIGSLAGTALYYNVETTKQVQSTDTQQTPVFTTEDGKTYGYFDVGEHIIKVSRNDAYTYTTEDWTMAISTNEDKIDLVDIIAKTIHELTHLLRFGGIEESKREIIVKDGICTARVDKKRGTVTKHYSFEEGLVEKHSKDTIEHFYEYLKSEKDLSFSPILQRFKRKFNGDFENGYIFEVSLIETLCMNPKIKELFEETFEINNDTPRVITYIDEVSKQRGMFSLLSNGLDRLSDCTHKGDINGAIGIITKLRPTVTRIVNTANKQYTNN